MLLAGSSDHHAWQYSAFAEMGEDGINSRLAEHLRVEDWWRQVRKEAGAQTHLRSGDLFEKKDGVEAVTYNEVARRLYDECFEEILMRGNHDQAAGGARNTLEALARRNVRVVAKPRAVRLDDAMFHLVPYDEDPTAMAQAIAGFTLKGSTPNVLVVHGEPEGAATGSEYVLRGKLSLNALRVKEFDLVLLGHIHMPQELAPNCYVIGNFVQRYFSDEGPQRRAYFLDTTTLKLTWIHLPGPNFRRVVVDNDGDVAAVEVDANAYYMVVIRHQDARLKTITARFEGQCLGWTPVPEYSREAKAKRIAGGFTTWADAMRAYIKNEKPDLDPKRLLATGEAIVEEVLG